MTQNFTDPMLGRRGIELLERGASAVEAIAILGETASEASYRQLSAISRNGKPASFTGSNCLEQTAEAFGADSVAVGNLLANKHIADAMVERFERSEGHLAARLIDSLKAGRDAGGEIQPVRSAGVVVVDSLAWPIVDLRVDWNENCPIDLLWEHWLTWQPVMPIYMQRATAPSEAPASDQDARTKS